MSIDLANYVSASALVRGAEVWLRSAGMFNDLPGESVGKFFGRQPAPGRPPRNFGQWYAALHWAGGRGDDSNPQSWNVPQGLVVVLTARLNYAPRDRQAIRLTTPGDLYDLACTIAGPNVIHGSYELLAEVNKLIPGTTEYLTANGGDPGDATVNGFEEPLVLERVGPEREESAQWIGATDAKDIYVIEARFKDARHLKPYTG